MLASSGRDAAPLPPSGLLDGVPDAVAEQARWWERHIVEIDPGGQLRCRGSSAAVRAHVLPAGEASFAGPAHVRLGQDPPSAAKPPDGPFGSVTAARPEEWMQIDSTPIDVRVVLDTGVVDRAELTWIIDLATRSIPAAVLRPTTKAADAAVLLARTLTPEPMRPGWVDALRTSRSVLPRRRLTEVDERLEHAAARPVIVPETIGGDRGRWLGPGRPGRPQPSGDGVQRHQVHRVSGGRYRLR